jgi:hypothetical protein
MQDAEVTWLRRKVREALEPLYISGHVSAPLTVRAARAELVRESGMPEASGDVATYGRDLCRAAVPAAMRVRRRFFGC